MCSARLMACSDCPRLSRGATIILAATAVVFFVTGTPASADDASGPYPRLVTAATLANPQRLAAVESPGKILLNDDFESPESLKNYFEIRGLKEGRARLIEDPKLAHSGRGAIKFTAVARNGRESGTGATGWLGAEGFDRVSLRCYIRFASDYDQGNLNIHYTGIRWRSDAKVRIKRFGIDLYVHHAERDNTVWYDDLVLSTGYVGPKERAAGTSQQRRTRFP